MNPTQGLVWVPTIVSPWDKTPQLSKPSFPYIKWVFQDPLFPPPRPEGRIKRDVVSKCFLNCREPSKRETMLISSYRLIYTPLCYRRGFRVDVSKALYFIWNCKREINKNPCLLWGHKYNFHEDTNITTLSNKSFAQTWWKDKFPFSLMKFQLLRHSKLPEQKCY